MSALAHPCRFWRYSEVPPAKLAKPKGRFLSSMKGDSEASGPRLDLPLDELLSWHVDQQVRLAQETRK